ncbi:MAG: hypothetical protein IJX77_04215 [Ruminococcus sp.]|nr:hypothetical protein [Ruminococcus sp.]
MKKNTDKKNVKMIIAYSLLLAVALAYFILAIFVFQKPDGAVGCILCVTSILTILFSGAKIYQHSVNGSFWDSVAGVIVYGADLIISAFID